MDLLLILGIVIVAGLRGGQLARALGLPSVTGYLLSGVLLGPSFTGLVGTEELSTLEPVIAFALRLIVLSIGAELRWSFLQSKWEDSGLLFLAEGLATFVLVSGAI